MRKPYPRRLNWSGASYSGSPNFVLWSFHHVLATVQLGTKAWPIWGCIGPNLATRRGGSSFYNHYVHAHLLLFTDLYYMTFLL